MDNATMKVLLVDDEPDILEILDYNLSANGYSVSTAADGKTAIEKAKKVKPDLILLDVMMPEMDGVETCEKIRALPGQEDVIIAFLTARGEDYSQVAGFEAGGDDYITKPIKPKVLLSRVKALLRRKNKGSLRERIIKTGSLSIDRDEYKVMDGNREITLPRKEFELLALLASQPGKVFNREDIMNKIWGAEVVVGGRTIDVHVRKIREKIGSERLKTVKGVGYKFTA